MILLNSSMMLIWCTHLIAITTVLYPHISTSVAFSFSIHRNNNSHGNSIFYKNTNTRLYRSRKPQNDFNNLLPSDENLDNITKRIRLLGRGDNAIVRPGAVLVAPKHEYSHFLMKSAIFIHRIGRIDTTTTPDEQQIVIRGVIIDHPTAFTMSEMCPDSVNGVLGQNILFRGGDVGKDTAIMLHSYGESLIPCGDAIGSSGIYEGGVNIALNMANEGLLDPEKVKFFFNYVEFTEQELDKILSETDSDGDAWTSLEVPSSIILGNHFDRGDAWSFLRNQINEMMP